MRKVPGKIYALAQMIQIVEVTYNSESDCWEEIKIKENDIKPLATSV